MTPERDQDRPRPTEDERASDRGGGGWATRPHARGAGGPAQGTCGAGGPPAPRAERGPRRLAQLMETHVNLRPADLCEDESAWL